MLIVHKALRMLFTAAAVGFLGYMAVMVYVRSEDRASVLRTMIAAEERSREAETGAAPAEKSEERSELHLQEFHRVEIKGGRKMWEVRAKDAKYFMDEGVTQVNDASLRVYRKKQAPIDLKAHAAKLVIEADALQGVELEGEIIVSDNRSFEVHTDLASFDVVGGFLKSPSAVVVRGPGYEVRGIGMEFEIASQKLLLEREVISRFVPGAKAPGGLQDLVK